MQPQDSCKILLEDYQLIPTLIVVTHWISRFFITPRTPAAWIPKPLPSLYAERTGLYSIPERWEQSCSSVSTTSVMGVICCTSIPSRPAKQLSQAQQICNAARFCCLSLQFKYSPGWKHSANPLPTLYLLSVAWRDANGTFFRCCSCHCLLSHFFCWPALRPKSLLEANHFKTPSNVYTLSLTYPKPSKTSRPIPHIRLGIVTNMYI